MANTYNLLRKVTVGAAGAAEITFTSIPQTYTDLLIKISCRGATAGDATYYDSFPRARFNGDAGANYNRLVVGARGTSGTLNAVYTNETYQYLGTTDGSTATASAFGNLELYIPNYTSSNKKSLSSDSIMESNTTTVGMQLLAGLWNGTSAITSITIDILNTNAAQYSTFYLYGVAKEGVSPSISSAAYATGGDDVYSDGTYWYHTFKSSGTFIPRRSLSCDYLVVGGGGGGGGASADAVTGGGGAGAGGMVEGSLSVTATTSYPIIVGSGGTGGTQGNVGSKGGDSSFSIVTGFGGGAGRDADDNNVTISIGGSGGGASGSAGGTFGTSNQTSPSGGTGYGNSGGTQNDSNGGSFVGGGGGGAGSAGSGRTAGSGRANSITGSSVTYAAGGFGQGTTNNINAGVAGTPNTGNGGNGANKGAGQSGGAGGSGIVVIRYLV